MPASGRELPARGIGARTVEQLQDEAGRQGKQPLECDATVPQRGTIFVPTQCGQRRDAQRSKGPDEKEELLALFALIKWVAPGLRGVAAAGNRRTPCWSIVDWVSYYRAEREGTDRVENLNKLVNAAASFIQEAEESSLGEFLAMPLSKQANIRLAVVRMRSS